MNLEGTMLSEISWTEKDNYHMISYMKSNLKNKKSFSLAGSLFYSCLALSILMIQNFKRLFQFIGLPAPRSKVSSN